MINTECLILGGGISGIYAAYLLGDGDYRVVERESVPGGYCRTIKKDGFVWDYAGHFFHFADEKIKSFFESKINKEELIFKEKNTKIFFEDRYIDYPFQKNIHQLSKEDFISCLYDLFKKESSENYDSFEGMLYGKFGKSITNMFLKPYNEKLYSCDLNELDVDAMGRFFPYADIEEIIDNMKSEQDSSYNNTFLYPKNGAETFVEALFNEIDKERVHLEEEVLYIDIENRIVVTSKNEYRFEKLISSIPFDKFISLTKNYDYSKSLLPSLSSNKVLVLNLGFNKKSPLKEEHWIYYPSKDINFYRLGFYDNILNSERLSMYVEIGYPSSSSNAEICIEGELKTTLENLRKIGVITDHELVSYESILMDPAYVHISKQSNELKEISFGELEDKGIYMVGRYGRWKYCSIEDSMIDARVAVESVSSGS
ncbi:NAD(P)-binding protein [Vibrio sp. S9_S30]|uniref:protoporphyrinogen/coproporphyrinogen oxidase n=1 Tax=Vibrio sp. S9_S30 TaxID=2720226 RepID=UPI001681AE71|nr:NAD(P)-binding protein [Vibrio sp. S9_S30]MBD1558471.1 NAD(P)-binding protein [Vibrio sp. S9_S30]